MHFWDQGSYTEAKNDFTVYFQALCKDLERAEIKKWLQQILEILMAERGKEERAEQLAKLDSIIQKHEVNNILKYHLSMILYDL